MLRCQFLCHVLKALFFIKIALKLSYFCKMQNFREVGALPPDPRASGSWELCPQSLASGGWGRSLQTHRIAHLIVNFWLRTWMLAIKLNLFH